MDQLDTVNTTTIGEDNEEAAARAARAALAAATRIVVKIGTATITKPKDAPARLTRSHKPSGTDTGRGRVDSAYIHQVAEQFSQLVATGKQLILVTSGAIGMGARELGITKRLTEVRMRQACAAIGQPILMEEYRKAFGVYGLTAAQLLVTRDAWDDRASYLNLQATIETLLADRVVPVFNENDTLSTAEIGNAFGDNDRLSAYVASKIGADLLIILSDVDYLYDADPRTNPRAKPVPYVRKLTGEQRSFAGDRGSEFSTGGMKTKLAAVEIARDAGCRVVIAHGREQRVIARLLAGEAIGTLFDAEGALKNRIRWLKNSQPKGSITVDEGALAAMKAHKSLLPRGVLAVEGDFGKNSVVLVNRSAKLISSFSSAEIAQIKGERTEKVESILGKGCPHVVARPEEIAFLDE
ncbi:Glutamate 5-kinase [uncultured Spirochaetota bacterium]|jgi:glutamate 5-kinase|nr:Glutamate 5-kinase [uncultured Spirochaetota bacterium]